MNYLAKHFFEYQSCINLPHHALQMHKTPPSQAGTDPAAAWAPKDLHVAGKNQAAPAARAARNYHCDQRTGSHRHGRPSKLEFRNWGERHGELRAEKILPHQEHLLHGHMDIELAPQRRHTASGGVDNFPSEYFPARHFMQQRRYGNVMKTAQQQQQAKRVSVLVILTMAPHLDFVTVTVKSIRGMAIKEKIPSIHLCFFDGQSLVEERVINGKKYDSSSSRLSTSVTTKTKKAIAKDNITATDEDADNDGMNIFEIGESFLLRVPSPLRLPFCHIILSFADGHQLMGFCQLGPTGSMNSGNSQWRQMIKKLGAPIVAWHELHLLPPDEGCSSTAVADNRSPSSDERCHTIPRRRTTVSVSSFTVGPIKALSATNRQKICNETKALKEASSSECCGQIQEEIHNVKIK